MRFDEGLHHLIVGTSIFLKFLLWLPPSQQFWRLITNMLSCFLQHNARLRPVNLIIVTATFFETFKEGWRVRIIYDSYFFVLKLDSIHVKVDEEKTGHPEVNSFEKLFICSYQRHVEFKPWLNRQLIVIPYFCRDVVKLLCYL